MYKLKKFFCVIALFSVFLSFSISSIAFADENYNIDVPFTLEDFDSFDEYTEAINMYLNPEDYIAPLGTVDSGELGTENVTVRLYAGPYANWYTEEHFSSSADLAYTKQFAISAIASNLPKAYTFPDTMFGSYLKPLWGYTCTFALKEGETVSDSTVIFNLDFSGDKALTVNGTIADYTYIWNSSSYPQLTTSTSSEKIALLTGSLPDLIDNGGDYFYNSSVPLYTYCGNLQNVLTFQGITSSGDVVDLATYNNTTGGQYKVKLTDDEFTALVFDMEYYYITPANADYSSKARLLYFFPYSFKADFSGSITFDQNSIISGLISSIIQWLKQILNAILSLPQKIADLVIEGLKTLFVPSADDLQPKFDEFKTAAYSKLGFVYQVATDFIDLLQELFNATVSPTTTLTIPQIALPWDKVDGGQMVLLQETTFNVFPENLEGLRTLCKTITSMVLVLAFYRSVLSAFEKFFKE